MKIALCTTTIHVPHALKLMRKCSADVGFFVAVEQNVLGEVVRLCYELDGSVLKEGNLPWKCSEAIGWNTLARRNIAFLEALKRKADIIYSWDNDNIPIATDHFDRIETTFSHSFNGLQAKGLREAWFDPGKLLIPMTRHRGFPQRKSDRGCEVHPVTDARIGVAAGLVLGDPDIDATTRMEVGPYINQIHMIGQTGVVVDPNTWTVFNAQNTSIIRDLVPAFFQMPNIGRHDDIYASLIVQRVARERALHVHFGPPLTYQQRNEHNLITDLRKEIDGMENVVNLADLLDSIILPGKSVIEDTRIIYQQLTHCSFIPEASARAGLIWLDDCEGVL